MLLAFNFLSSVWEGLSSKPVIHVDSNPGIIPPPKNRITEVSSQIFESPELNEIAQRLSNIDAKLQNEIEAELKEEAAKEQATSNDAVVEYSYQNIWSAVNQTGAILTIHALNPVDLESITLETNGAVTTAWPKECAGKTIDNPIINTVDSGDFNKLSTLSFSNTLYLSSGQSCRFDITTSPVTANFFTFPPHRVTYSTKLDSLPAAIHGKTQHKGPGNARVSAVNFNNALSYCGNQQGVGAFDCMAPVVPYINSATFGGLPFDPTTGAVSFIYTDAMRMTAFASFCQQNDFLTCGLTFSGNINDIDNFINRGQLNTFLRNTQMPIQAGMFRSVHFDMTGIVSDKQLTTLTTLVTQARVLYGNDFRIAVTLPGWNHYGSSAYSKFTDIAKLANQINIRMDFSTVGPGKEDRRAGVIAQFRWDPAYDGYSYTTVSDALDFYRSIPNTRIVIPTPNYILGNVVTPPVGVGQMTISTPFAQLPYDCVSSSILSNSTFLTSLCSGVPNDVVRLTGDVDQRVEQVTVSEIYGSTSTNIYINRVSPAFFSAVLNYMQDIGGFSIDLTDPRFTGLLTQMCRAQNLNCDENFNPDNASFDWDLFAGIMMSALITILGGIFLYPYMRDKCQKKEAKDLSKPLLKEDKEPSYIKDDKQNPSAPDEKSSDRKDKENQDTCSDYQYIPPQLPVNTESEAKADQLAIQIAEQQKILTQLMEQLVKMQQSQANQIPNKVSEEQLAKQVKELQQTLQEVNAKLEALQQSASPTAPDDAKQPNQPPAFAPAHPLDPQAAAQALQQVSQLKFVQPDSDTLFVGIQQSPVSAPALPAAGHELSIVIEQKADTGMHHSSAIIPVRFGSPQQLSSLSVKLGPVLAVVEQADPGEQPGEVKDQPIEGRVNIEAIEETEIQLEGSEEGQPANDSKRNKSVSRFFAPAPQSEASGEEGVSQNDAAPSKKAKKTQLAPMLA